MLKTYGLYFCITVAVLFVQTSVFLPWGNHGIRPDLLMFIVLWAAVSLPAVHSGSIIVLIAFLFEALSGAPSGLFISTYLLIFAFIYLLRRFFNFNTLVELFGLLLACLGIKYLLLSFFLFFVYEYLYTPMFLNLFRETLFTMLLFPLVFPLIQKGINQNQTPGTQAGDAEAHGS